jgi:hypothetical protein
VGTEDQRAFVADGTDGTDVQQVLDAGRVRGRAILIP